MKLLLMIKLMFLFSACAHYEGHDQVFWTGQAASDSANAAANAGMMHIHHHTPAGMP